MRLPQARLRSAGTAVAAVLALAVVPAVADRPGWVIALSLVLCAIAACIAVEDLARMLIPDRYTVALALAALGYAYGEGGTDRLLAAMLDAAILGACLLVLAIAYERLRGRSGLGFGDVKLLSASALLVGFWGVAIQILLASLAALIFAALRAVRRRRPLRSVTRIPFATFLAPAVVLVWAWLIA